MKRYVDSNKTINAVDLPNRPLRVECAWCRRVLRDGPEPVSHGICPECRDKIYKDNGLLENDNERSA